MSKKKILLIDDDQVLLELLSDHIAQAGFHPVIANNGKLGLRLAAEEEPALVILDVMMPQMDGWEVCKQLRENSRIPIIMLTAKEGEIDKLRGFRLGVDDYVTKPFSFAEIIARVGAVLNRVQAQTNVQEIVSSGDISVDLTTRKVTLAGDMVELTPTEYRLLALLVRNITRTVPTEQILVEVWGTEYTGETDHVKRYIWALRKKLEADPGNPQHILTERGFGYRFE